MNFHSLLLFLSLLMLASTAHAFGLKQGEIVVDGVTYWDIEEAEKHIRNGSFVYFGPGIYRKGIHIKSDDVYLSGEAGTHFKDAAILNKGVFVVSGKNVTIESIECSDVGVYTNNGACVRQQADNLIVRNVHFHNSQQGILQAHSTGRLTIEFSLFDRLGHSGRAHAVYSHGSELIIKDSVFTNSQDEGHEIKSRSKLTHIENTLISSGDGDDSRLIDISDGGKLVVINSILYQGPNTVNSQAVGYGLENMGRKRKHEVVFKNNIIILERPAGNIFIGYNNKKKGLVAVSILDNVFVGNFKDSQKLTETNWVYQNRTEAKLANHKLPSITELNNIINYHRLIK